MKQLLKLIIIITVMSVCNKSYSQRYGIKAGLNLANISTNESGESPKTLTTFNIGTIVDFGINDFFSIQPGLFLSGKGFKMEESYTVEGQTINIVGKVKPLYINVPVLLMFKTQDLGGIKLFGGAGPFFGIGIAGKIKATAKLGSETVSFSEDIRWGNDENSDEFMIKQGDAGIIFAGGMEINPGLIVSISYDLGLSDISPGSDSKECNRILGFSVGFLFGK